jgi:hypothetical protein
MFKNLLNKKSNLFKANLNEELDGKVKFKVKDSTSINSSNSINNNNKNKKNNNIQSSNLNICFPMIKKTEIKNKDIFNFYEFNDEDGGNIIIKSRVIYSNSSDFNSNNNSERRKDILEKEINYLDSKSKLNDLNDFKWDNINEYFLKQEKLKMKEKALENKPKKEDVVNFSIYSILLSKIKDRIYQRFEKFQLKKVFVILLIGFIIQLIVSRK